MQEHSSSGSRIYLAYLAFRHSYGFSSTRKWFREVAQHSKAGRHETGAADLPPMHPARKSIAEADGLNTNSRFPEVLQVDSVCGGGIINTQMP